MAGYSLGVNGKKQVKLKGKSWDFHGKDDVHPDKDVRQGEDVVPRNEERTYVSILVLSRSRLLSRSSQACNLFPNTRQAIYIFRNK